MAAGDAWLAGWRPYALLAALCLCLYLPGIATIPVLDRDEARFAQATRQMLESGDFLRIRFRDEPRNNKPAGIYWLQAAAVGTFSTPQSTAIWPYRLPSLIAAGLAAMATFAAGRALLGDRRAAAIGAVLVAAALGVVAEAHIAKTDAALLAATAAGQCALGLCYLRSRADSTARARPGWGTAAVFWAAEIAAIFLKGPIGPGLALLTAGSLALADRDWRWLAGLRPLAGLAAVVLTVGPWLYAIERATAGGFVSGSLGHDFLAKLSGGQEAHGAPPLYYLALSLVTFWPGSLLLAPALIHDWRRRAEPAPRFLLAWLVPAWIVLELVPTKLPHYALPLYPALALLAGSALAAGSASESGRWARRLGSANAALWVVVTLAIAGALAGLPVRFGDGVTAAGLAGAAAIVALAALLLLRRPGPLGSTALLAALGLAVAVPGAGWVVPGLDRLWLSRGAAALVAAHPPPETVPLAVVGYNEPSLVFLLRDRLRSGTAGLDDGGEALVNSRDATRFNADLAARRLVARPLGSVAGLDYSNGQPTVLTLYRIGGE
ncbi:MAG TPA: phospholipid carrier-dependent glycosyltransferase [Stellaceae bacterium]|nr:phospholipid carrier-dependent glycosyltransferase [Stellaceae bacterium]